MRHPSVFLVVMIYGGILVDRSSLAEPPGVGDMAPAFELEGSDGMTYTLAQFKDETVVVFAWFPKAFTSG